ncbi:MAG: PDZ domain-containing protein [Oligoflexia bacterium]|nr:PDZ domain-containing protein [Oligoflexia bacterium]
MKKETEEAIEKEASSESDAKTLCSDINIRIYLIGILATIAILYTIFGWGRSDRTSLNQTGRTPESLIPPEAPEVPELPEVAAAAPAQQVPGQQVPVVATNGQRINGLVGSGQQVNFALFGTKSVLGMKVGPIDQITAESLGLRNKNGVVVLSIVPGGMSDLAGIKRKDVIFDLGHREVNDVKDFQEAEKKLVGGRRYKVRIIRDKKATSVHLNYDLAANALGVALNQQAQKQTPQIAWMGFQLQKFALLRLVLASMQGRPALQE